MLWGYLVRFAYRCIISIHTSRHLFSVCKCWNGPDALEYAPISILHRDLKTTNILISGGYGPSKVLKIGDFGISKIMDAKGKAATGTCSFFMVSLIFCQMANFQVVGTPSYLSPELCEGREYNEKSDIWALGCILYEMCAKKKLFEAPNLPSLVMKIMVSLI